MTTIATYRQRLASAMASWGEGNLTRALAVLTSLREEWPGNSHIQILWASLVQLQTEPVHGLDEAKDALQRAIDLDESSPRGPIELGHFLDAVEDEPGEAIEAYRTGISAARGLLIEGLIGQAKALRQLDRGREFNACVVELLNVMRFEEGDSPDPSSDLLIDSPNGRVWPIRLRGPFAEQVEELLDSLRIKRPA